MNNDDNYKLVEAIQEEEDWVAYRIDGSNGETIRGRMRGLLHEVERLLHIQVHKANGRRQLRQAWHQWSWTGQPRLSQTIS